MARLFIRHKPVDCVVESSVNNNVFYLDRHVLFDHKLQVYSPNNCDVTYVCIVSDGQCWDARSFNVMGNKQVRVNCIPFNEDPCGQQMILADMILN
jgi:hypothetical protein